MDSVTHIVLGACIGEGMVGKAGKRVLVAGAVAQSLPDIDFVASFWLSPASDLLAHRGFTHSFLFVILAAPALALITERYLIPRTLALRTWLLFYGTQVFVHIFLDAFNAYGTGWFEPFSEMRISFNTLFVADPFFTLPLVVASGYLVFSSTLNARRRLISIVAISFSCVYLGSALLNKALINTAVKKNFESQGMSVTKYFTTPTPLNSWLWYIVANNDSGSYVGYRSIFDDDDTIAFEFFPRREGYFKPAGEQEELRQLKRFSQGYYTAEKKEDALVFNDLRFGQMIGWRDRRAGFVFHYYLSSPESFLSTPDNELIVQRGRFLGWDGDAARSLLVRALGHNLNDREPPGESKK